MARERIVHPLVLGDIRERITLSNTAKLIFNPATQSVQLRQTGFHATARKPTYPLDTDLTITISAIHPTALKAWAGFCALPTPARQPAGTQVRYKLNDGTNDRYWDGAAWSVAGAANWNTELEIAAHIATFPIVSQSLSVVCNLVTTDKFVTPSLYAIGVLLDVEIDFLVSLLEDALLETLKGQLETVLTWTTFGSGAAYLSLLDLRRSYVERIQSISAVYNHADDPDHSTNLYSSYDSVSQTITLTSAISTEDTAWVEFRVSPESHINYASQNYTEVASFPAVVLDNFEMRGRPVEAHQWVWNLNDNSAAVRRRPHWMEFVCRVVVLAGDAHELLQMMQAMLKWGRQGTLAWSALDQKVTLDVARPSRHASQASLVEIHQGVFEVRLSNVYFWLTPETSEVVRQSINLTFAPQQRQP